jgi:periplasmic protein TonB
VARAAPQLIVVMRDGANRSFGLALLASILLHALLLAALPSLRELAAQLPQVPAPLVARLLQPAASPAASVPTEEARNAPAPEERPAPPPPAAKSTPPPPVVKADPQPVAKPAPAPAPQAAPALPVQSPAASAGPLAMAPATAASLPSLAPLARLEPLPAPAAPAGPDPGALDRYRLQLVTVAARFKRYPRSAIDNNWEGVVVVRMTIGTDGRIAALGIKASSGHEVLDRQALEMFRVATPFVQLPPELAGREFELDLRAIYSLKDQPSG